ncbi:hypothetical protein TNCV_3651081 [Trichonephila clavipes]|nr:hypothetical protein TNCV_3651081 [Trichonephila clavipes]
MIHRDANHFCIFAILRNAGNGQFDRDRLATMVKHVGMGEKARGDMVLTPRFHNTDESKQHDSAQGFTIQMNPILLHQTAPRFHHTDEFNLGASNSTRLPPYRSIHQTARFSTFLKCALNLGTLFGPKGDRVDSVSTRSLFCANVHFTVS